MRPLTAADLLAADDLRPGQEPTPEWGAGTCCYVAQLNALERDQLEEAWADYKKEHNDDESNVGLRAFWVAFGLCDERNVRLFKSVDEVATAAASLKRKHARPIARLFNLLCEKNALLKRDVEELEKNSPGSAPGAPSGPTSDAGNGESPSASAGSAASSSAESAAPSTPSSKRSRSSSR